jgi:hypothetical protein
MQAIIFAVRTRAMISARVIELARVMDFWEWFFN